MDIQWIKDQLEQPGKSKSGLATFLGIPNSAVTEMLKGNRAIKLREVPFIKQYFSSNTDGEEHGAGIDRPARGIFEIDVIAGLGGGGTVDQNLAWQNGNQIDPLKPDAWHFPTPFLNNEIRRSADRIKIIETFGDSMSPTIQSGDRVIIDTDHVAPSPDGLYAVRDRYGSIVVKRLQALRRGDPPLIRIISDNKSHDSEDVGADEIAIVGRVLWSLKRL